MKKTIKLWGMPFLLCLISLFGLVIALVGEGTWDYLGWVSLSVPLILIIKHYYK